MTLKELRAARQQRTDAQALAHRLRARRRKLQLDNQRRTEERREKGRRAGLASQAARKARPAKEHRRDEDGG